MKGDLIPFGEMPGGTLTGVEDVERGAACGVVCPECHSPLVARRGEINRHHFAHLTLTKCSGGFETAVHRMAKQLIVEAKTVLVPDVLVWRNRTARALFDKELINFDHVGEGVWIGGLRPDLIAVIGQRELAIEICVTHKCEPEKIAELRRRRLAAIEINLSQVKRDITAYELAEKVIFTAKRKWISNSKAALVQWKLNNFPDDPKAKNPRLFLTTRSEAACWSPPNKK